MALAQTQPPAPLRPVAPEVEHLAHISATLALSAEPPEHAGDAGIPAEQ